MENAIKTDPIFDFLYEQGKKAGRQPTKEELKKMDCQTYREAREKGLII